MTAATAASRDPRYAVPGDIELAEGLRVDDRVWLDGKAQCWTVQARDDRYIILTKPFNLRRTVLYTVIDLELGIRGRDDYHGLGYETLEQCERALARFNDHREGWEPAQISVRSNVTLEVTRVEHRDDKTTD